MASRKPVIDKAALAKRLKQLERRGYSQLPTIQEIEAVERQLPELATTRRGDLLPTQLTFLGFTFGRHKFKPGWATQIGVYSESPTSFVLTLSEMPGTGDVAETKRGLGATVPGRLIAPYAMRGIKNTELATVKTIVAKSFPGRWYWAP